MKTTRKGEWLEILIPEKWNGLTVEKIMKKEWDVPRKLLHRFRSTRGVTLNNEIPHWKTDAVKTNDLFRIRLFESRPMEVTPAYMEIDTAYEDDHLLVVNKPAGIHTHPNAPENTETLVNGVAFYFQMNGIEASPKYVHRLDRDTSGAILFAKHDLAIAMLGEQLKKRTIKRTYIAWVEGKLPSRNGKIQQPIGKDRHHPVRRRVSPNGQEAETNYEVIEYDPVQKSSLIKLELQTGRTHQIRVHLSYLGHPLLGDTLYGGKELPHHKQALHAAKLSFVHPFTEENIVCYAAPDPASQLFTAEDVYKL
ncbi:RluA family pseudouridine synthase [Halobacillus rhizosphaerae]|uniref:RluA family pseudouridine synthase n=1 Tax=Halobacillus rhizosphaerae TaxID=3064889 RepID=UPI00398B1986